jgi:hypothetical protein
VHASTHPARNPMTTRRCGARQPLGLE